MIGTTLFLVPHQDDEVLSMGNSIIEHVKRDDTHVLLFTDGSDSYVKKILEDNGKCSYHIGIHSHDITKKEFTNARDIEFKESCKSLGLKEENIHIEENRLPDGQLTKAKAKDIITDYLEKYPGAKIKTTTPYGNGYRHKDHKALGQAALELYNDGIIKDLRFYIEPYEYENFKEENQEIKTWNVLNTDEMKLHNAMNAYKVWKPYSDLRYAIGYHSAGKYFDFVEKDKKEYVHAP
ncbi:MAG: PIG-L family deacetylase [Terrisporobacter sp.]